MNCLTFNAKPVTDFVSATTNPSKGCITGENKNKQTKQNNDNKNKINVKYIHHSPYIHP